MRIFLTGASGFVGSYLLRLLLDNNHAVQILLRPTSDVWRIQDVLCHNNLEINYGSLDDPKSYDDSLKIFKPSSIIHLAWQGVGNKNRNDYEQIVNIQHAQELAKLAIDLEVNTFIGLGSQAEYGPCSNIIDESQACLPTTCYGIAKLATSLMLSDLFKKASIRFAWLRLFSSYGPKDDDSWLIPYLINSFLENNPPKLTGCEQLWDYIHIKDVASAIYAVLASTRAGGMFNLGSGHAYRLIDIVKYIENKLQAKTPAQIGAIEYRPDQVMHLEADIGRLHQLTAWQPEQELYAGLDETIQWYSSKNKNSNKIILE